MIPVKADGSKQPALPAWKQYQQEQATIQELNEWFGKHPSWGLALVTGKISGGLIALDFDDPQTFNAWVKDIRRDARLWELYDYLGEGYEEKTPKGGRHILFRCPEAFNVTRRPGNQKLALRPVPPPQRFETLAETREEGGLIIIDPSCGPVHPSGRPYRRIRGSVSRLRSISPTDRELLYASVKRFDEVPVTAKEQGGQEAHQVFPSCSFTKNSGSVPGERPGDLFMADLANTWESLLLGWDISEPCSNAAGYLERYVRHPGKVGPNPSCTLNADGTNRLFVFSPSVGLPLCRYLNRFEFYAHWHWGGDFSAAAHALVKRGYRTTMQKGFRYL